MEVIKEKDEFGLRIFLNEDEKYLAFTFGGNGDLYWAIHNESEEINEEYNYDFFEITKENYGVYRLFEKLFLDVENINIFDIEDIPFYLETDEERANYVKERRKWLEEEKAKIRLYNWSHYNELFDGNKKTITWYSDETAHEVSNYLKIIKEKDKFRVEFFIQPHIRGYERDFNDIGYISVRFCNSGSSYEPFNTIFMKMYNDLPQVDDINDFGHQVHMEEYLYNQKLARTIK